MSDQITGTAPYFVVADIHRSVAYYRDQLGFDDPPLWGEPPTFAMPRREGYTFMLKQVEGPGIVANRDQGGFWDAYVWVRDCDALHAELAARGAVIDYGPTVQEEYGNREFAVRDPDGHVIAFGQVPEA